MIYESFGHPNALPILKKKKKKKKKQFLVAVSNDINFQYIHQNKYTHLIWNNFTLYLLFRKWYRLNLNLVTWRGPSKLAQSLNLTQHFEILAQKILQKCVKIYYF